MSEKKDDNLDKIRLTASSPLGKLCAAIRDRAADMDFGTLDMTVSIEVNDGLIRQIDYSFDRETNRLR